MGWEARGAGGPFRAAIQAAYSGAPVNEPQAAARLSEFALCERLGWSYQQLQATPALVVRDFLFIMHVQAEIRDAH